MLKTVALLLASAALMGLQKQAAAAGDTAQLLTPTLVLDWAEKAYPTLFPGGGRWYGSFYERTPPNLYAASYVYRYYGKTGHYVGMQGEDVLLVGPASGGQMMQVGRIEAFACSINRAACANPGADDGPLFVSDPGNGEISVLRHRNPKAGTAVPARSFSLNEALEGKLVYDKAKDRLFAMTVTGVVIVDKASQAAGAVVPTRRIEPATLYIVSDMHYDKDRDTLFLLGSDNNSWRNIVVFDHASQLNGTIAPDRAIRLQGNWSHLAIDARRSIAYVKDSHSVWQIPNIYTADGLMQPTKGIAIPGETVAVDSARDRLYTLDYDGRLHSINNASTPTSMPGSQPTEIEVPGTLFMAFDEASDRIYLGARSDIYVLNAVSKIAPGNPWSTYGIKLTGAPYMWFEGFGFP